MKVESVATTEKMYIRALLAMLLTYGVTRIIYDSLHGSLITSPQDHPLTPLLISNSQFILAPFVAVGFLIIFKKRSVSKVIPTFFAAVLLSYIFLVTGAVSVPRDVIIVNRFTDDPSEEHTVKFVSKLNAQAASIEPWLPHDQQAQAVKRNRYAESNLIISGDSASLAVHLPVTLPPSLQQASALLTQYTGVGFLETLPNLTISKEPSDATSLFLVLVHKALQSSEIDRSIALLTEARSIRAPWNTGVHLSYAQFLIARYELAQFLESNQLPIFQNTKDKASENRRKSVLHCTIFNFSKAFQGALYHSDRELLSLVMREYGATLKLYGMLYGDKTSFKKGNRMLSQVSKMKTRIGALTKLDLFAYTVKHKELTLSLKKIQKTSHAK